MTMGMSFPAWMTAVVSRPIGLGKVFYVHGFDGLDTNNGVDPGTPFKTITYAIAQCVSLRNDYIIVLNAYSEATPILVNKRRIHIIGLGCDGMPLVTLTEDGDNDPIFEINADNGDFCEIAGFDLGGGDAHGAIEPTAGALAADMVYIHHCNFGSEYCGNTPLHGVWLPAGHGAKAWKIDSCKFMGTNGNTGGKLTGGGVSIDEGAQHQVSNCIFQLCVAPALSVTGYGHIIINNTFNLPVDGAGAAIDVQLASHSCLIDGNSAMEGAETEMAANPYRDNCAGNINDWGHNYALLVGGVGPNLQKPG